MATLKSPCLNCVIHINKVTKNNDICLSCKDRVIYDMQVSEGLECTYCDEYNELAINTNMFKPYNSLININRVTPSDLPLMIR